MKRNEVVKVAKSITTHDKVVNVYNSINPLPRGYRLQYSDAWCASFVSVVFHQCGYDDIAECSCLMMMQKAIKLHIFIEDDNYIPSQGDIILYDWDDNGVGDCKGIPDHVGIVIDVTDTSIIVREGNKGGVIGHRTLNMGSKYIRGYILPPYEKNATTSHTEPLNKVYKSVDDIVNAIIKGEFGNGDNRKEQLYNYFQKLVNEKLK